MWLQFKGERSHDESWSNSFPREGVSQDLVLEEVVQQVAHFRMSSCEVNHVLQHGEDFTVPFNHTKPSSRSTESRFFSNAQQILLFLFLFIFIFIHVCLFLFIFIFKLLPCQHTTFMKKGTVSTTVMTDIPLFRQVSYAWSGGDVFINIGTLLYWQ